MMECPGKFLLIIVGLTVSSSVCQGADNEEAVSYSGAQVWKVSTQQQDTRSFILNLIQTNVVSDWKIDGETIDVMVTKHQLHNIAKELKSKNISYVVKIQDVQQHVDNENVEGRQDQLEAEVVKQRHNFTLNKYHRLDDIYGYLKYLVITYPKLCTVKTIGKTIEGRELKVLRLSNGKAGNKAVFIDGGIHAREWISPATVLYIINQFAEKFDKQPKEVTNIDWYFIPVVNPDGYEYTHTTDRLWRKNRGPTPGPCIGIDLCRNFGYKWGGPDVPLNDTCDKNYPGTKPFSELESQAYKNFVETVGVQFHAFIAFHSYGQYIVYPWSYDTVIAPDDKDLNSLANIMNTTIAKNNGANYTLGNSAITLYPASGTNDDWLYSKGVKYTYVIELPDEGKYGFVLPAKYIRPVGRSIVPAVIELAKRVYGEKFS